MAWKLTGSAAAALFQIPNPSPPIAQCTLPQSSSLAPDRPPAFAVWSRLNPLGNFHKHATAHQIKKRSQFWGRNSFHENVRTGSSCRRSRCGRRALCALPPGNCKSRVRVTALPPFEDGMGCCRPGKATEQDEPQPLRHTQRQCMPQPRDTPPKRDTGIASEKDWGIHLKNENKSESGVNGDGSAWYSESGEDRGENGYRCRWTVMGGRSADGSSEWKEAWWEKSDWTGYKELGAEKSGKNAQGDTWWETWQEVLRVDELSNLARIEKSAQKQAKSGTGSAGWFEKWWEKYNAKGWSEKGAHKYGRLNDQGWWEKWGEQYDGRGAVLKWTDKWAETDTGTKWGNKWEERFDHGIGTRQGETWHNDEKGWSRTWGEEHFGNGRVHKYGRSTSGESWDNIVEEGTFYEAEPHYGWADAVGNSVQLLSIVPVERPSGTFPGIDPSAKDQQNQQ